MGHHGQTQRSTPQRPAPCAKQNRTSRAAASITGQPQASPGRPTAREASNSTLRRRHTGRVGTGKGERLPLSRTQSLSNRYARRIVACRAKAARHAPCAGILRYAHRGALWAYIAATIDAPRAAYSAAPIAPQKTRHGACGAAPLLGPLMRPSLASLAAHIGDLRILRRGGRDPGFAGPQAALHHRNAAPRVSSIPRPHAHRMRANAGHRQGQRRNPKTETKKHPCLGGGCFLVSERKEHNVCTSLTGNGQRSQNPEP